VLPAVVGAVAAGLRPPPGMSPVSEVGAVVLTAPGVAPGPVATRSSSTTERTPGVSRAARSAWSFAAGVASVPEIVTTRSRDPTVTVPFGMLSAASFLSTLFERRASVRAHAIEIATAASTRSLLTGGRGCISRAGARVGRMSSSEVELLVGGTGRHSVPSNRDS